MHRKSLLNFFFLSAIISCTTKTKEIPSTIFTDVAKEENVTYRNLPLTGTQKVSSGAAWFDCDNDGDLDLYVSNLDGDNQLFRNNRIGKEENSFTEIAKGDAKAIDHYTAGVAVADYDNDGDNDIYLANIKTDVLLQNDGTGNFKDITHIAFKDTKNFLFEFGASASWGDINNDGWLDLYVTNNAPSKEIRALSSDHLFINNGGNPVTFTDRSDLISGDHDKDSYEDRTAIGFMSLFTDYNLDGDLDIYVLNDCPYGPEDNKMWHNNGDLTFTEVSEKTGPFTRGKFIKGSAVNDCHNCMGIASGDPNHDGYPDYHFTNVHEMQQNSVLLQNTGEYLINVSAHAGLDVINFSRARLGLLYTWGTVFIDYDLDTWQDLAMAGGSLFGQDNQPNMLFHNEGADIGGIPKFEKVGDTQSGISNLGQSRTFIRGDYDMDGDPDLFLVNLDSTASLYRNNNHNGNKWLIVDTKGAGPPLSNLNGIGAKVYVTTPDDLRQFYEIRSGSSLGGGDDIAAYFGLGNHGTCDVEIIWPSGIRQKVKNVKANQRIKIKEPNVGVTFPKGGEFLIKGETYTIKWKTTKKDKVQIVLRNQGSEEHVLADNLNSTGSYRWALSEDLKEGQGYEIVIKGIRNEELIGKTNAIFSIINPETEYSQITYPNGRELLQRGKMYKITWESNASDGKVDLALLSGDKKVMNIASATENDGMYEWNIPDSLEGNNYKIEIINETNLKDQSDQSFAIIKKLIKPQVPEAVLRKRMEE